MSQPPPSAVRRRSALLTVALVLVGGAVCACLAGAAITLFDLVPIANPRAFGQTIGQLIIGLLVVAALLFAVDRSRKRR